MTAWRASSPSGRATPTDAGEPLERGQRNKVKGLQSRSWPLFSVKQVATKLNCSDSFVYARIADGSLKHYRLGAGKGGIRVSQVHIDAFLAGCERGGRRAPRPQPAPAAKLKHLSIE